MASTVGQENMNNAAPGGDPRGQSLLRVSGLSVQFGGIVALEDVSFDVMQGQIAGVIGPNGAGKTTLFNCLSRLYPFQGGSIFFRGQSLLEVPRHRIADWGIGRTFQNLALFRTMSVLDNIMVGAHCRSRGGFFANALRTPVVAREELRVKAKAMGPDRTAGSAGGCAVASGGLAVRYAKTCGTRPRPGRRAPAAASR